MRKKIPKIRLFFALKLNRTSEKRLLALIRKLEKQFKGRFYPAEKLHLTLAFLGWVRKDRLQVVKRIFKKQANHFHPFKVETDLLELCRRSNCRNHLWLRFKNAEALENFQGNLLVLLKRNKFPVEKRRFLPHLTIARQLKTKKKIKEPLELKLEFSQFLLYQSTLLRQGSRYTKLLNKSR